MTAVYHLHSFRNIAAGLAGLLLACALFFAAAPQAQAAQLTQTQVQAVINLLVAFDVEESAISEVSDILNESVFEEPTSSVLGASTEVAVAPACPELAPGAQSASASNGHGSCTVSATSENVAMAPPAPPAPLAPAAPAPASDAPDVAGLMATAAMAPWFAAVDSLSQILFAVGVY